MHSQSPLLPVMLRLENKACVVIGAGKVALRRVNSLLECGALVSVIAPEACIEIQQLAQAKKLQWHPREYEWGDLKKAFLAVLASNAPAAHDEATKEAQIENVLINRTDAPKQSDVDVCAHARQGRLTLAVHTSGASARAAADIRDELLEKLDPTWVGFLDALAVVRAEIQAAIPNVPEREALLKKLASVERKQAFAAGGVEGLRKIGKR